MKNWITTAFLLCAGILHAQQVIHYRLTYAAAGDRSVHVRIELPTPRPGPLELVMPRNYPGGYELVPYDSFVDGVAVFSAADKPLAVRRTAEGPRWVLGEKGDQLVRVEYAVDLVRMEQQILSAVDTSKVRPRYAGLLGYSVFAYIDGLEDSKIALQVDGAPGWPVFSTLAPRLPASIGSSVATASDYYALADSEVLMGPDLQLRELDGPIKLILAAYLEEADDLAIEGQLARTALDRVQQYFGDMPFPTYTVQLELLKPLAGHDYSFSQEHLDSGTFSLGKEDAMNASSTQAYRDIRLLNYAHHMAHSWIPKRAYGEGYMPFVWEMPPIIDTIWFNEGFGRYAAISALAAGMPAAEGEEFRRANLRRLRNIVEQAPPFIRRMPTVVLSREASFLYSTDFRIGMNIFARGSLMAAEMDEQIRQESQGKSSLREALRALLARTEKEHRPFKIDELPAIFKQATGVDVRRVLERWLQPSDDKGLAPDVSDRQPQ